MKYGDVCIETLRLCYTNGVEFLDDTGLEEYRADERYSDQLQMMRGAVNRCFGDMETRGAMPERSRMLEDAESAVGGMLLAFVRPPDALTVVRIACEGYDDYCGSCEYAVEGDRLLVRPPKWAKYEQQVWYRLIYRPSIPRITADTGDYEELPVPEELAVLIPYFCAGDIDRLEEPARAADMRNRYEAGIMQVIANREADGRQELVSDVMTGGLYYDD